MKPDHRETLLEIRENFMSSANKSSEESIKQIILIDSAALALLVAFASNQEALTLPVKVLITIAIASFVFSIVFGVIEFLNSTALYRKAHDAIEEILRNNAEY